MDQGAPFRREVQSGGSANRGTVRLHGGPVRPWLVARGGKRQLIRCPLRNTIQPFVQTAKQPGLLLFWFRPADRSQATAPVPSRSGCRSMLGSPPSLLRGQHQQVVGCISSTWIEAGLLDRFFHRLQHPRMLPPCLDLSCFLPSFNIHPTRPGIVDLCNLVLLCKTKDLLLLI